MSKTQIRANLKFLLLQYRRDSGVKKEEKESFARFAEIKTGQIKVHNFFREKNFAMKEIKSYDAVFIGGSSDVSVFDDYDFLPPSQEIIRFLIENRVPTFASCFGFQLALRAFGAEIVQSKEDFEMGTYPIFRTEAGKEDPLLENLSDSFYGVSVHKQKVTELPRDFIGLGRTKDCWHIVKHRAAPFWAFQFHPEIDDRVLRQRLTLYQDQYTAGPEHLAKILENIKDTTVANKLCRIFIDKIVILGRR